MTFIYETAHFRVEAPLKPHVSRTDGGHIRIGVRDSSISDRSELSPALAVECAWITTLIGEALQRAMNECGIPVVKINYQEMGNWAFKTGDRPVFHIHLYGRASNAEIQKFPESVYLPDRSTGFYNSFEPLNNEDIATIQKHISLLEKTPKYQTTNWQL